MANPLHEDDISQRQQDRTDEEADQTEAHHAAKGANQDDRHRGVNATPQQHWLEKSIRHAGDQQVNGEEDIAEGRIASPPELPDDRERDHQCRKLQDADDQDDDGKQAGCRDVCKHKACTE